MIAAARVEPTDAVLAADVLLHLDTQLESARRLLAVVLKQGDAIKARDVQAVVALTGILQAELGRRGLIENERARLLERAGARLGVTAGAVNLTLLESLLEPGDALQARTLSGELRGLLAELRREHAVNRALMSQELAFLDHLLRLADGPSAYSYDGDRPSQPVSRQRALDLQA